jgi:AraC-like DNA-binding protein
MLENPHPPSLFRDSLPYEVCFRIDDLAVNSHFPNSAHPWGQLNYCATGIMELTVGGKHYLSPPQYAVWIPPDVTHSGIIRQQVIYHSAYLDIHLCKELPSEPCALVLSPLLKAILADFATRQVLVPTTAADKRLAQVLVDQLLAAPRSRSYLPHSDDPVLSRLLNALQREPANNRSLAEWAQELHITERTLTRRCQRELGMSLNEWRQRQRFLAALPMLENGDSIQSIAFDLGYSTASAFIAMFRRQSGCSPDQFRRESQGIAK